MAEQEFESLSLVGKHEPDYSTEVDGDGNKRKVQLPGLYHVGFVRNGAFHTLYTLKHGGLLRREQRAAAQPVEPSGQE